MAMGAGTSAAITEVSYINSNPEEFSTTPFLIQYTTSAAAGAITSNPSASISSKYLANIVAAEAAYFTSEKNPSLEGALLTAAGSAIASTAQLGMDSVAEEFLTINRPLNSNFDQMPSASSWISSQNARSVFYGGFSGTVTNLGTAIGQRLVNKILAR
jgi:hypothetical protein